MASAGASSEPPFSPTSPPNPTEPETLPGLVSPVENPEQPTSGAEDYYSAASAPVDPNLSGQMPTSDTLLPIPSLSKHEPVTPWAPSPGPHDPASSSQAPLPPGILPDTPRGYYQAAPDVPEPPPSATSPPSIFTPIQPSGDNPPHHITSQAHPHSNHHQPRPSRPVVPTFVPPPTQPTRSTAPSMAGAAGASSSYNTDDMAMVQAQKHAKWAISALNFEDVPTAVRELKAALGALGAG